MTTPIIGITTDYATASWEGWHCRAAVLSDRYVKSVAAVGALPVLLPPVDIAASVAVAGIDALVVSGGSDVDPGRYGAVPSPDAEPPNAARDEWELALLRAALAVDLPVLGICRGMQLLNVVRGGTLRQHLDEKVDAHRVHRSRRFLPHRIAIAADSALATVLGPDTVISSQHHQAVDTLGRAVKATAWADDGTVEAVELVGHRCVIGIQGHPEEDPDPRLFAHLAAAARAHRRGFSVVGA